MKRDWKKIRAEYLSGKSREEICRDHNVSYKTLDSRIFRERWKEKLKEIAKKTQEKTVEKVSESLAEIQTQTILEQRADSSDLIEKYRDAMADPSPEAKAVKLSHLKIGADILYKAYAIKRQAVGLKEETDMNLILKSKEKVFTDEELEQELKKRKLPVLDMEK